MAVYGKSKLPDTPWHVGYTKKDEHDPRRHKAWCIHLKNSICTCGPCGCFMTRCDGSSHCKFYAETEKQWEEYLEEMKTDEDRAYERAELYKQQKRQHVRHMLEDGRYTKTYRFGESMLICPFCKQKIKKLHCDYCLATFRVVKNMTDEAVQKAAKEGVFLIKAID